MNFKSDRPIYRQIVDYCFNCILSDAWKAGERVPSVRELALSMSVNTHTVLKAYEYLQNHYIIESRRGMGFYLCADAREKVNFTRREDFFESVVPDLFQQMSLLGISLEELIDAYKESKS
ncbi:MAG: GntR family transcriptional regulator [Paramuribaculum sp.]|nr:GntR family transcriptional regulator [Paramuribaculum sp.]